MMKRLILGGLIGAAAAYFLDPENGARRRQEALDRLGAGARDYGDSVQDLTQRATDKAQGVVKQTTRKAASGTKRFDDATLTEKVKTELYGRDPEAKGHVNVSVQNGLVQLRGELQRPEQITVAIATAESVDGVNQVENLLHLAGTPAPTS